MKDLRNKFHALVARMQTEEAANGLSAAFRATPEELADAVKQSITPRTSITSPLRIDAVQLEYGDAAIGMTICPGKKGTSTYGGSWDRDLAEDIDVIRLWGCKSLLTLMESGELEMFRVTNIGDVAASAAMRWHHVPISDGDPPDGRFDTVWPVVGRDLLATLCNGNRVVIHCRGGLGRTGMIACLLLIELGESPAKALERVRIARPGAVETIAQESFVLNYSPAMTL